MRGSEACEREGVCADVALKVGDFLALQRGEARSVEVHDVGEERGGGDEVGDVVVGGRGVLCLCL